MKNKKAVSLSMNTVIIAALSIIVLFVLIYLLLGSVKDTDSATLCTRKGGVCMDNCPLSGVYSKSLGTELCDNNQECCVPNV